MTPRDLFAPIALTVAAVLAGCAAEPTAPTAARRSTGTLVDESNEGAYDRWEVFPATDADESVVILASGSSGASGAIRFLPSEDATLTIIVEADGASSQLDLDADGSIAGQAHAPAADALLAELMHDVDGRHEQLIALASAGGGAVSEEGGARAALGWWSLDFSCVWSIAVAWTLGFPLPECNAVPSMTSRLRLLVVTPFGKLNYAEWFVSGSEMAPQPLAYEYIAAPDLQWVVADIPRTALARGIDIDLEYTAHLSPLEEFETVWRTETRTIHLQGTSWGGERQEVLELSHLCNDTQCDVGVCQRHADERICSDVIP